MRNNIHNLATGVALTAALALSTTEAAHANPERAGNVGSPDVERTHYLGSVSTLPLQAETTPMATTLEIDNCIKQSLAYSYTQYEVGKRSLVVTGVVKAPEECASITEVPITLQGNQKVATQRGGIARIRTAGKPVELRGIQTTGLASIASDAEGKRRAEKRTTVVVNKPLTKKTAPTYGMTTRSQVVPRNPMAIDPTTGAIVPSPVGTPKVETTRANPWLIIPQGAKRSTKKPWRTSPGQTEYLDNCNLLATVSEQYPTEKSKYVKAKFIPGPHEDAALDTWVVKFKNAKVCKGGGMIERRGDAAMFGFRANMYTQTWASFQGSFLPGNKEIASVAFTGLINGTKPKKFGLGV